MSDQYLELLKRVLTGVVFQSVDVNGRYDPAAREEGRDWPSIGYTMVGLKRLDNVQHAIETVLLENIPGDIIECGTWRGGCSIFMRAVLRVHHVSGRTVWVADSFLGLPPPNAAKYPADEGLDLSKIGYLSVPLEAVEENFSRFGLLDDQVRFLGGWFRDTLPTAPVKQIAVLRADGDLYESTMDILENLYGKVSFGGFVIIDDYSSIEACRRAVTDFRASRKITDPIIPIDWTGVYWRRGPVPASSSGPSRAQAAAQSD